MKHFLPHILVTILINILFVGCATEETPVTPEEQSEIDFNPYAVAKEAEPSEQKADLPAPPKLTVEADEPSSNPSVPSASVEGPVGSGPEVRYITSFQLNVRTKPNRFAPIIRNLDRGTEVHVKITGGWAELEKGQYIRSRHLSKKPVN